LLPHDVQTVCGVFKLGHGCTFEYTGFKSYVNGAIAQTFAHMVSGVMCHLQQCMLTASTLVFSSLHYKTMWRISTDTYKILLI
jgi:hypothetical protein